MKSPFPSAILILLALTVTVLAQESTALPNPSFEKSREGRPYGWRAYPSPPEAQGDFYVSTGEEGTDTHTGSAAIQFSFPDGADLVQCAWIADPVNGGMVAEPGRYSCSFWIKAEDLRPGYHAWVVISGFDSEKKNLGEVGRSGYLRIEDLPFGVWTLVSFSIEVPPNTPVARIAPSVIFKTDPKSTSNFVPPTTKIVVDDLEISQD